MTKMNPEIKSKWLAALRSGEYKQTQETLKCDDGFCCLGVLTDLYIKEAGEGRWEEYQGGWRFNDGTVTEAGITPEPVMKWAELEFNNPNVTIDTEEYGPMQESVAELNDHGKSFTEIADLIEKSL